MGHVCRDHEDAMARMRQEMTRVQEEVRHIASVGTRLIDPRTFTYVSQADERVALTRAECAKIVKELEQEKSLLER